MTSLQRVFQDSRLEILVPSESLRLASIDTSSLTWWTDLHKIPQRTLAFFGQLSLLQDRIVTCPNAAPFT